MICPKCSAMVRVVLSQEFHNGATVTLYECINGHSKRVTTAATKPLLASDEITNEQRRRDEISIKMKTYLSAKPPAEKKAWSLRMAAAKRAKEIACG